MTDATTPQFDMLAPGDRQKIMADIAATGRKDATVAFSPKPSWANPHTSQKVAVSGPVFANPSPDYQDTGVVGPLTSAGDFTSDVAKPAAASADMAPISAQHSAPAENTRGALSAVADNYAGMKVPTIQDALAQYAPQDGSRDMYFALSKGFGSATKTGNFGEQIGSAAEAMQNMRLEQEKLKMQYLPAIMTQMAAQQKMQMDIRNRSLLAQYLPGLTGGAQQGGQPVPVTSTAPVPGQGVASGTGVAVGGPNSPSAPVAVNGVPTPTAPSADAQSKVTPQAVAQVQNAWQKEGLQYPITQAEAVSILLAPDPMAAFSTLAQKHSEPTGPAMLAIQAGYKPGTPEFTDYMQKAAFKANHMDPVAGREGGYLIFPDGHKEFNPKVPPGMIGRQGADGQMHFTQDPDLVAGISAAAGAELAGKNANTLSTVYPVKGGPAVQTTVGAQVDAANGRGPAPGSLVGAAGATTPVPTPGSNEAATARANQMGTEYSQMSAESSAAPDALNNLHMMRNAIKTAVSGPNASVRDVAVGLLGNAGFMHAMESKTSNDLVDKNTAQLVLALRQAAGGGGTDALQSLGIQATPNRKMNVDAFNEATDQLIAKIQSQQARATVMQPKFAGGDFDQWSGSKLKYDQNANPIIFKRQNMNEAEQAANLATMSQGQIRSLAANRANLKAMGVDLYDDKGLDAYAKAPAAAAPVNLFKAEMDRRAALKKGQP